MMTGQRTQLAGITLLVIGVISVPPTWAIEPSNISADSSVVSGLFAADTKTSAGNEREAAQLATQRYGGKVLRVKSQGNHFEVRLLMDDGRVRHVKIPAKKNSGKS